MLNTFTSESFSAASTTEQEIIITVSGKKRTKLGVRSSAKHKERLDDESRPAEVNPSQYLFLQDT